MNLRQWAACSKRAVVALTLAAGLGALVVTGAVVHSSASNPTASLRLADPHESPSQHTFAPVVKKVLPAVVNISTSKVVKTPAGSSGEMPDMDLFRQFFGRDFQGKDFQRRFNTPKQQREHSLGSGVIVSPEGYILTNNHVIDGATDIRVTLSDKRELKARLIGADPRTDIAVLRVDAANLPTALVIGDSSKMQVGDTVLAIGNPFGLGGTVTSGIVSATGRTNLGIEDYEDFIQTDAAVNPGNSGGALTNDRGELIGINTAILSGSGGNQGVGFAVPVNLARQVMDEVLKTGKVTRGYMGIMIQNVTPPIAKAFGLNEVRGALVGDVTPDGPAQKAGLQKGDIILDLNGTPVNDSNQLRMAISMMAPGSNVNLKVFRNGSQHDMQVRLAELPGKEQHASAQIGKAEGALEGVTVENLTPDTARELGLPARAAGVVVTNIDASSQAAASGLQEGDVIQEVNRRPVSNMTQFDQAVRRAGNSTLLLVNRKGNTLYLALQ